MKRVAGYAFSFSPGFNRVIRAHLILPNRFNGLPCVSESETVETVQVSNLNLAHPVETG